VALALDATAVYWTDYSSGVVASCAKTGCGMSPTVLAMAQANPFGIAVDSTYVYWVNSGTSGTPDGAVVRCAKAGCGGKPTVVLPSLNTPETLALDATSLYVTTGVNVMKLALPL